MLVSHIPQLVTHGKAVSVVKSDLSKITARKDIISNKQFLAQTIYRQVLIVVNKFCLFSYHQLGIEILILKFHFRINNSMWKKIFQVTDSE